MAALGRPWGSSGTCESGEAGWSGRKGGCGLGVSGGPTDLGMSSVQSLQGRVFPPLPASAGSRHPSLGWWPPPSHLCLRLHTASPLCPCLSSSVSYKDPVPGFRATPIQEDLISDPSLHHNYRDPISKQAPFPRLQDPSGSLGPTFSSAQHLMRSHGCPLVVRTKISARVFIQHHWDAGAPWHSP